MSKTGLAKKTPEQLAAEEAGWLRLAGGKYLQPGTNIIEIDVPNFLRQRITTGIEWVDRCVGGKEMPGFTPSCVTMLTAVPGGGKTTMCMQIADALTSGGCSVLYNSGEESPEQLAMTRERLNLHSGFIIGADYLLVKLLEHLEVLRLKHPKRPLVLIVDSIKTINDGKYSGTNSMTPLRVMKSLVDYAKEHLAIVVTIGHVTKKGTFEGKEEMRHMADAHGHIKFDLDKRSPTFGKRIFAFQKNRFGPVCAAGEILKMTPTGLISEGSQDDYDLDG